MKLIVIGSSNNAQLKINNQYVSGCHAELLILDNGEILLTDKNSTNGTFLNNQRIQPGKEVAVKRGDVIRLANYTLDWNQIPSQEMPDMKVIKEMRGIGTNFRNKYLLQGEKVDRFHATLVRKADNKWYIQDHSQTGTTINGQQIPSNQYFLLKRGDRIACAGVEVENPYGKGGGNISMSSFNYRKIFTTLSLVFLLFGGIYGVVRLVKYFSNKADFSSPSLTTRYSDEEIYTKYKNSTAFMLGFYYYKISAGNLDLKKDCNLPTEVIMVNGKIQPVNGSRAKMHSFTGTAFFVSKDGKLATNLHITRPWLFDSELSLISDQYRMFIASAAEEIPALNAYTSQVKVEGVLSYLGMLPNGAYFSEENLKRCRELKVSNNVKKDVAIIQLESKKTPENVCVVDLDKAVVRDADIKVGSHIYTMGFPFGLSLQDVESSSGVQLLANGGSITQECNEYSFGFNAPSYGGASGSPVFNEHGQLIGVLNSGVSKSQGFNFAIKAAYIKALLYNN